MDADVRYLRTPAFDSDYWLCRCEGFLVDSPGGRVGFVEGVRFRSRLDRPDLLAVRAGFLSRRRFLVPVEEVVKLVPREERVILRATPEYRRPMREALRRLLPPRRELVEGGDAQ
jgi:hypothetical protein